jgi:NAD(P)-dependent dehydrogenase (short-subunit alcohol dehydrogenase family)
VVGGAGGGIGAETVRRAAAAGAAIAIVTHNQGHAAEMIERLRSEGVRVAAETADVTDEVALVGAITALQESVGPIRHLVNVVGGAMSSYQRSVDFELSMLDRIMAQNLRYAFVSCREVARDLLDAGLTGSIVNISSGAAAGRPMLSAYSAAKAALESFSRAVALEWAPRGIRVNVVSSGTVRTASTTNLDMTEAAKAIPLRRRGEPEEVAYACLFLLSDLASYTTGSTLEVDGGIGLGHPGGDDLPAFVRRPGDGGTKT